ncbi:uncharacterized protein LOC117340415 [Pecten maximus]|uniref:uncharacterized protein LOC117340415 n=1 Tax=Pecten maximus TaxID=6579 RepID=UPI00145909D9|nr:uncharacterized protein LOC117340415 [Pecten maximus]
MDTASVVEQNNMTDTGSAVDIDDKKTKAEHKAQAPEHSLPDDPGASTECEPIPGHSGAFSTTLDTPSSVPQQRQDKSNRTFLETFEDVLNSSKDMAEVGERLKMKYSEQKPAVIPGHMKTDDGSLRKVFVVYSPHVLHASNHEKEGIGLVMLRNPYKVDNEARTVSQNKGKEYTIPKEDMERAKQVIQSHSNTLWCNHSNLNIISVSSVRSKRKGAELEQCLCIVLYCSTKGVVPIGEEEFPRELDSVSIDVREGYFELGGYNTLPSSSRHRDLKMGCNIGKITKRIKNGGGSLGPLVNYNDKMSFLTCAHVLFDFNPQINYSVNAFNRIYVAQPSPGSSTASGDSCGFVQRAIFNPQLPTGIDVAVVAISDSTRKPIKGRFAMDHTFRYRNTGFKELPEYNNGSIVRNISECGTSNMVVQFGSETHLTKGSLVVDGVSVRPLSTVLGKLFSANMYCFKDQYEVEGLKSAVNMFLPGDSGSAVFMLNGTSLHCIGMSIGHMSNGSAVVTPIGALLDALGPTCRMETF